MAICTVCGTDNAPEATLCGACGSALSVAPAAPAVDVPLQIPEMGEPVAYAPQPVAPQPAPQAVEQPVAYPPAAYLQPEAAPQAQPAPVAPQPAPAAYAQPQPVAYQQPVAQPAPVAPEPAGLPEVAFPMPADAKPKGGSSRTMLWVLIGILVLLVVGAGGYYLLMMRGSGIGPVAKAPVAPQPTAVATAAPVPAAQPTPAPEPAPAAAPNPETNAKDDGRQFCEVKRLYRQDGRVWAELDFEQLFLGDEAVAEAAKDGATAENDFYVRNASNKLRRFPVASSAPIVIEDESDSGLTKKRYTLTRFFDEYSSGGRVAELGTWYFFTIKDGEVVKIENMWTP